MIVITVIVAKKWLNAVIVLKNPPNTRKYKINL